MTDDKNKEIERDSAYLEDMAPPMGQGPDERGLTPDQIAETRIAVSPDEYGRKDAPGSFLLNRSDAKYLLKANIINLDVWSRLLYENAKKSGNTVGGIRDEATLLQEVEKAWKEADISVSRLQRIYKKTEDKEYWNYRTASVIVLPGDYDGEQTFETNIVIFLNGVVYRSFPEDGKGEEILQAKDPKDRARLAEVPEGVKYLPYSEQDALDTLRTIVEAIAIKNRTIVDQDGNWAIPNSAITNLFSNIGRSNILDAQEGPVSLITGGKTSVITSGMGVQVTTIPGEEMLLTDPEADRVFKVFLHKANAEGYKNDTIVMPQKEVQEAIGLSDPKDAKIKIGDAIEKIMRSPVTERTPDADFAGAVLFDSGMVIGRKGRGGNLVSVTFGKTLLKHLRSKRTAVGYINTKLLKERNPDAYKMGVRLGAHLRNNINNLNEHRIGVTTLLETSNIPPYESLKDKGQAKQLIIDRFETYMERLIDDGILAEWTYSYPSEMRKGTILTDEDLERARRDYHFFSRLVIEFKLTNEELYDNLRQRKKAHPQGNK